MQGRDLNLTIILMGGKQVCRLPLRKSLIKCPGRHSSCQMEYRNERDSMPHIVIKPILMVFQRMRPIVAFCPQRGQKFSVISCPQLAQITVEGFRFSYLIGLRCQA